MRKAALMAMAAGILGGLLLSYGQHKTSISPERLEMERLQTRNRRLEATVQVLEERRQQQQKHAKTDR